MSEYTNIAVGNVVYASPSVEKLAEYKDGTDATMTLISELAREIVKLKEKDNGLEP